MELRWIIKTISNCKNVDVLSLQLGFNNKDKTIKWLDDFVSFLYQFELDHFLKNKPILPNQNGDFLDRDDLFLDDGEIDETLKDISTQLGYDIRAQLLDVDIFLELPEQRTKSSYDLAEEIGRLLGPRFAEVIRSEETKQIFNKLFSWFSKNKEKASLYFGDLYVTRNRLYDDDEIAVNIDKAEQLSALMTEYNIEDLSELRVILHANKTQDIVQQKEQITQMTLVSLGVTSIDELELALQDRDLAKRFVHTSTPTIEMFLKVQNLINRAKKNVIQYLQVLPDYDCSEMEELATTVIGGIKKDGLLIHVVIRPSDNREVIVYYSSEKDTLDYANAELWIDNGVDQPRHLTLGRILKTTGINKIPV